MFLKRWLVDAGRRLDVGRKQQATAISLSSPRGTTAARKKNGFITAFLRYAKQNRDFASLVIGMAIIASMIMVCMLVAASNMGIYKENFRIAPQHYVMSPLSLLSRFGSTAKTRRPRGHRYFDYWQDEENEPFPWKFMKRPLSSSSSSSSSKTKVLDGRSPSKMTIRAMPMDDESYVPESTFIKEEQVVYNDPSSFYAELRESYESFFPPPTGDDYDTNAERALQAVQDLQTYTNLQTHLVPNSEKQLQYYDIHDCPETPPEGYPVEWNLVDEVLRQWPADDPELPASGILYQGLCVFDVRKNGNLEKALNYRNAEVPFVVRGDPQIAQTVERWNTPDYLQALIGDTPQGTELSASGSFTYWTDSGVDKKKYPEYKPPTQVSEMTFSEWLELANVTDSKLLTPESPHYYFKVVGCAPGKLESTNDKVDESCSRLPGNAPHVPYLADELPFYAQTKSGLYVKEPLAATPMGRFQTSKALNCRFGMKGVMATNHFDGERNFVTVLSGERRYVLASPKQCGSMALFPYGHPSARHSAVDWADPNLEEFPEFAGATGNEIVLQAGDSLFLPSLWFHYIVSLSMNVQCNTRSGLDPRNVQVLDESCGW